jgi:sugar phosphate isomerase/epimerase
MDEALDALVALGLDRVELWLGHATTGAAAAAEALVGRGLEAAAVGAGGFYRADSDVPARASELAEAIGAPVVVMCVAPRLASALAGQVAPSLTVCVENHWDQPLDRPHAIRATLQREPSLAACLDTGHALLAGVRPERFARGLGPRLRHVHLKEAQIPSLPVRLLGRKLRRRLLPRPAPVPPGGGALDVPRLRAALAELAFDGTVTVEHEGAEPESALRRLLLEWESAGEVGDGC